MKPPGLGQDLPRTGQGVAIIGMSCLFPGCPNLDAYWQNILNKVDSVTDPTPGSWDTGLYYDPEFTDHDKVYCRRGGYLGSLASFDPLSNSIPPVTVGGEPDQWLALQLAQDALADAGCSDLPPEVRHRTAIVLGKGTYLNAGNALAVQRAIVVEETLQLLQQLNPHYSDEQIDTLRQAMKQSLPPLGPETVPGLIPNIIVGRIANRLDLMGPTYTVDAACASSLVAVQLAMRDLLTGECDLALAGGSQVWMPVPVLNVFCQLGALSPSQQIRPFDKDADGTLLGEGIGLLVLKRVADAVRDGDRIYAVVRGVGVASDGRGVSVMAPRIDGEELALRRAYAESGVSPRSVGLLEAHGTATPVGDVVEVQALTRVFGSRDGELPHCALGTVKSMISHTIPASGVAGMIKAALALYHQVLPPTLHCRQPNPKLELEKTPFYVNAETRPWIQGSPEPRRAGVNAFGFGGINAHAVIEEFQHRGERQADREDQAVPPMTSDQQERRLSHHVPAWESEVCILEGDSQADLSERAARLAKALEGWRAIGEDGDFQWGGVTLMDVAYTVNSRLGSGKDGLRLAVVATSLADLKNKLNQGAQRLAQTECRQVKTVSGVYFAADPLGREGKLALVFPGEGAQYVNMLNDLCLHFPEVREVFDRSDRIYFDHPRGYLPSDIIFPRPAFSEEERQGAEQRLMEMDSAVEGVLTANQALLELIQRLGIQAESCVGHSAGEYSAALAAGVLDLESDDRMRSFSHRMYRYYSQATARDDLPMAVLLAVGADRARVESMMAEAAGELHLALDNCPHQSVVVGDRSAVERLRHLADGEGVICEELAYDRAVHTPLFSPYAKSLADVFDDVVIGRGRMTLYSCATAAPYPTDPSHVRDLFLEQWNRPVEFRRAIEALYADGSRLFVEVGPRGNLTAFIEDILRGRPFCAVPANLQHRSGITQINHLVGMLAVHGVDLNVTHLYARRGPRRVSLDGSEVGIQVGRSSSRMALINTWPRLQLSKEVIDQVHQEAGKIAQPSDERYRGNGHGVPPPDVSSPSLASPLVAPPSADEAVPGAENRPTSSPYALPAAVDTTRFEGSHRSSGVMSVHFDLMHHFLTVHEQIVHAYLLGNEASATSSPLLQPPALAPSSLAPPPLNADDPLVPGRGTEPPTVRARPTDVSGTNGATGPEPVERSVPTDLVGTDDTPGRGDGSTGSQDSVGMDYHRTVTQRLLALVSERTGYPIEMLDLNADLEADLGIDSIKRVEILGSYRQQFGDAGDIDFEQLARQRTLQRVVDVLAPAKGHSSPDDGAAEKPSELQQPEHLGERALPPLLGTVVSLTGTELVTRRVFDLADDLYLRDHCFGGVVSTFDDSLLGLAVMPLTMSLEILAEAAAYLVPRQVTGLRDVRAFRWIAWAEEPQTIEVTARRLPRIGEEDRVAVQLRNLSEDGESEDVEKSPVLEATVILGDEYPGRPAPQGVELAGSRPSSWDRSRLYTDGMFHGPLWQGVHAIESTASKGLVAQLRVLSFSGFLRTDASPRFVLDPVVLDAAGQVIGYWTTEHLSAGKVIFPFRLETLDIYGPRPPEGEDLTCSAAINLVGDHLIRSDIDVFDGQGQLWMRLQGWEDKRFDLPAHLGGLLLSSGFPMLSTPWPEPIVDFPLPDQYHCRRIAVTLPSDRSFWKRIWAQRILSRVEREQFRSLRLPEMRQLEWLGARTAAKEAVKHLLDNHYGIRVLPADIEVYADERGRPMVRGPWVSLLDSVPVVSLAHSQGYAVALAGLTSPNSAEGSSERAPTPSLVGIDVEVLRSRPAGFTQIAFSQDEEGLMTALPANQVEEWTLRCWCAKEAVAKGLGFGLVEGPPSVAIVQLDPESGRITVQLVGELAEAHPHLAHSEVVVFSLRESDLVVATTLCEDLRRE